MNKEIRYFTKEGLGNLVAVRSKTGSAIVFNRIKNKWEEFVRNYYQILSDANYDELTEKEAGSMFKDIPPDEKLLDEIDSLSKRDSLSVAEALSSKADS